MNAAIDIWADPVRVPQYAGGTFAATCYTVWHWSDNRWRRVGATISTAERDAMIKRAQVSA